MAPLWSIPQDANKALPELGNQHTWSVDSDGRHIGVTPHHRDALLVGEPLSLID